MSVIQKFRPMYPGMVRGEVIQKTSLGIAVKVSWDGLTENFGWIDATHIEKETRR